MLVHTVLFWLKPEVTSAQRESMQAGLDSLRGIAAAENIFVGRPADLPERPVRDSSYAFCLTVVFKDVAAHEAYQVDPVHQAFVAAHRELWSRIRIYDAM